MWNIKLSADWALRCSFSTLLPICSVLCLCLCLCTCVSGGRHSILPQWWETLASTGGCGEMKLARALASSTLPRAVIPTVPRSPATSFCLRALPHSFNSSFLASEKASFPCPFRSGNVTQNC